MRNEQRKHYQNAWARKRRKELREGGWVTIQVLVRTCDANKVKTFAAGLNNIEQGETQ